MVCGNNFLAVPIPCGFFRSRVALFCQQQHLTSGRRIDPAGQKISPRLPPATPASHSTCSSFRFLTARACRDRTFTCWNNKPFTAHLAQDTNRQSTIPS